MRYEGQAVAAVADHRQPLIGTGCPVIFHTPDVQEFGLPDLSTQDGQQQLKEFISDDIKMIVLDNISTLERSDKEAEGESW